MQNVPLRHWAVLWSQSNHCLLPVSLQSGKGVESMFFQHSFHPIELFRAEVTSASSTMHDISKLDWREKQILCQCYCECAASLLEESWRVPPPPTMYHWLFSLDLKTSQDMGMESCGNVGGYRMGSGEQREWGDFFKTFFFFMECCNVSMSNLKMWAKTKEFISVMGQKCLGGNLLEQLICLGNPGWFSTRVQGLLRGKLCNFHTPKKHVFASTQNGI